MVLLRPLALLLALLLPDAANPFSFSSRRRPEPRRATAGAGADASTCTTAAVCEGGTLCRPLSPQPTFTNEVVAYHADGIYGANGSEYEMYDYSKVTAIADYSWLYANETICTAHKHGVRVLGFNMIDMGALHSEQFYANESRMNAWIKTAARFTFDRGMDGIMLGQFLSSGTALSLSLSLSLSPQVPMCLAITVRCSFTRGGLQMSKAPPTLQLHSLPCLGASCVPAYTNLFRVRC
jgi:hypothetical protein